MPSMSKSSMSTSASPSSIDAVVRSPGERANDAYYFRTLRKILTDVIHRRATTVSFSYDCSSGKTEAWYQSLFGKEYTHNRGGNCVFSPESMNGIIDTLEAYAREGHGSFTVSIPMVNTVTFKLDVQVSPQGKTAELKATYGPKPYH